ncbi:MAG: hypothetical protein U0792_21880 [Gemmataceae bacterium]
MCDIRIQRHPGPKDLAIPPQELSKARELVRKLGSELYREREEAHAELVKMGRLARFCAAQAAISDADPEIRFRTSRLLAKAGADELAARLATFLADKDGKYEHDLPGLKQFRKVVGTDEKARALFVELVQSPANLEVLQALDRNATEGGRAISDRRTLMFSKMQHRNFGGKVVQPRQPSTWRKWHACSLRNRSSPARTSLGLESGTTSPALVRESGCLGQHAE